ncbi:MAG: RsmD family RNA methyltransferase [Elusimicrobiota bacterium]
MKALCRHFEDCGGCSIQDVAYGEQVEEKRKKLISITGCDTVDIIESPEIFGFRNKMEYSFEGENLGLHPKGRFDNVVDIKECPVFSDWIGGFLEDVRGFADRYSIPYYSRRKKTGVLRYLIVRESKFSGEIMVNLVVDGDSFDHSGEWAEMVKKSLPGAVSVIVSKRHKTGDSALTDDYSVAAGSGTIAMKIGNIKLDISPYSFFQPNSYQIENMYSLISSKIAAGRILDLYTGIGSIALYIADKDREILGIDSFPSCIENANRNLEKLKSPGKIEFRESTVKSFLSLLNSSYDYIILDPPRGGISYRIWKHLARLSEETKTVKKIIYVCCSLKNLKEDIDYIRNNTGWNIISASGIDQFVHTPHLETVVEMEPVN